MQKEIIKNIVKVVEHIPGIIGFVELDPDSYKEIENDQDYGKAIFIEINNETKQVEIKISIIISLTIAIDNIISQVNEGINFSLKKMNLKLKNINIFIKGVK